MSDTDIEAEDQNKDLSELIPDEAFNHKDCCHSSRYSSWESNVVEPLLVAKGYKVIGWKTTDGDSFGPLVRAVVLEKNGERETYFYG
jgi:hypothetical protein